MTGESAPLHGFAALRAEGLSYRASFESKARRPLNAIHNAIHYCVPLDA